MAETKNNRKRAILVVLGLVVVLIAYLALRKRPPAVPVVEVMRADLNASITSNGKVEPISPFVARAEFPTFVDKVDATEGQAVRRGEVILALDAADVRAQLAQARADLLAAQTDLENARAGGPPDQVAQLKGDLAAARVQVASLERNGKELEDLVAKQVATQDELAQTRTNLAKARANLEALEAKKKDLTQRSASIVESASLRMSQAQDQVRALEEKARSATVIAPFDGTLYSLPVKTGDYVTIGNTLAEMADLHHVRVRAFVDEPDVGRLAPGDKIDVTWDAMPDRTWEGSVSVTPAVIKLHGTRNVGETTCIVDNRDFKLLPNVNVGVTIITAEHRDVLTLPREAVRQEDSKAYVYEIVNNELQRRYIQTSISNLTQVEVTGGLPENALVALSPTNSKPLHNGLSVKVVH